MPDNYTRQDAIRDAETNLKLRVFLQLRDVIRRISHISGSLTPIKDRTSIVKDWNSVAQFEKGNFEDLKLGQAITYLNELGYEVTVAIRASTPHVLPQKCLVKDTAVCYDDEGSSVVESPHFFQIGAADTATEAWENFHDHIEEIYEEYEKGNLAGYPKP